MKPIRHERIASFLREELAQLIHQELSDPRIGFVTVTRVKPTEDIKEAVVYVSVLGTEGEQRRAMRGLTAARGFLQQQLGRRHQWRNNPVLRFELDESIGKHMEIEALIRKARDDDAGIGDSDGDADAQDDASGASEGSE